MGFLGRWGQQLIRWHVNFVGCLTSQWRSGCNGPALSWFRPEAVYARFGGSLCLFFFLAAPDTMNLCHQASYASYSRYPLVLDVDAHMQLVCHLPHFMIATFFASRKTLQIVCL